MAAIMAGAATVRKVANRYLKALQRARGVSNLPADEEADRTALPMRTMDGSGLTNRPGRNRQRSGTGESRDGPSESIGTLTPSSAEDIDSTPSNARKPGWFEAVMKLLPSITKAPAVGLDANLDPYAYKFKHKKVEEYPEGLPRLAAFLSSDSDFAVFRRFDYCHTRMLAHLEVEITLLEAKLHKLDEADMADPTMEYRRTTTDDDVDWDDSLRVLMQKLKAKLNEYGEIALKYNQLRSLGCAQERNYLSVYRWIKGNAPLAAGYFDFIYEDGDFMSLSSTSGQPKHASIFEELILFIVRQFPILKEFLKSKAEKGKSTDERIHYYSPRRIHALARAIEVSLAVGILLVPVFLLFLLPMTPPQMVIVVAAFVPAFALIMSIATEARSLDIFVGTAAYAAVLSTSLGNLGTGA